MVVLRPRRRVLYAAAPEAMFGARLGVHETGPPEAAKPRLLDRVRQAIAHQAVEPGVSRLMTLLLHGAGLRLLEYCRRRVKDVDFAMNQIVIRDGKGHKDRVTMLPDAVKAELAAHIERAREQHQADLRRGAGWVELPWALARKYPNAGREWGCSGCSRRRGSTWNGSPASGAATTCTSPCSSRP